ncbi:MAG: flotillin family protein, partial [Lautropia sp.]|nr:flotillin family protein [Lautropia sp.]
MTGAQFGNFLLGLIGAAIVIALVVWLLHWLYLRSSKERSFVRTGMGGTRVVLGGGAFVLPILHDVIPVNMNTLRLEVSRGRDKALITRDRMRVDVVAEFYVRVQASEEAIANAAQTLGTRTLQPEQLKELVEGKFVDALRTVAAEMTMEELHEKRGEYVKRVRMVVANDLLLNGLELETVSLTQLDQTAMEFFNPSNAFDAEGLTRLTEQIERRKKIRNDIEQDTMIQIRNKNLDTEKQSLNIERDLENARLVQERDIEIQRAMQRSELVKERAEREMDGERAQIGAREAIEMAKIATERSLEEQRIAREREIQSLEIDRRKHLELAEQLRSIAIAQQSKAQSEAQAEAD